MRKKVNIFVCRSPLLLSRPGRRPRYLEEVAVLDNRSVFRACIAFEKSFVPGFHVKTCLFSDLSLKLDPPFSAQPCLCFSLMSFYASWLSDLTYTEADDVVALRLGLWNCCHACKRGLHLEMEQVEKETVEFIVENVHAVCHYYGESLAHPSSASDVIII